MSCINFILSHCHLEYLISIGEELSWRKNYFFQNKQILTIEEKCSCHLIVLVSLIDSKETYILSTPTESPCLSSQWRPPEQDRIAIYIRLCLEAAVKFLLLKLKSMSLSRL